VKPEKKDVIKKFKTISVALFKKIEQIIRIIIMTKNKIAKTKAEFDTVFGKSDARISSASVPYGIMGLIKKAMVNAVEIQRIIIFINLILNAHAKAISRKVKTAIGIKKFKLIKLYPPLLLDSRLFFSQFS
jgi:hypothetical protein